MWDGTPLRDGLNLVAKEYVACNESGVGALVLSEFAGAAAEMGEAFLVNPFDEERTAEVVRQALSLPKAQLRDRMSVLRRRVARNHVFAWGDRFADNLKSGGRSSATEFRRTAKAPYSDLLLPYGGGSSSWIMTVRWCRSRTGRRMRFRTTSW
jgi:trehalose-6-phosphate synthase